MKESLIQRKIIDAIESRYLVYIHKSSDRFTKGFPDLLVIGASGDRCVTLLLEVKTQRGRLSDKQKYEHEKIRRVMDLETRKDGRLKELGVTTDGLFRGGLRLDVVRSAEDALLICEQEGLEKKEKDDGSN